MWCSTVLVGITGGTIEAHFHFFIIIGFIALYQDWVPFLLNILFTVLSHGIGSMWLREPDVQPPRGAGRPVALVARSTASRCCSPASG